jgi:hypothetical protein
MSAYVIYNSEGTVTGAFRFHHVENDAALIAANTPEGLTALEVDDNSPALIDQKGWSVVGGELTHTPPSEAELLAGAKTVKLADLTSSYEAAKAAGVAYMETTFMTDEGSQQIFGHALLAYQAIGATPEGFFTVDASYNKVPMDLSQLKGLVEAIAAQVWAVFQRWIAVREELAAATTVADVQAITWQG